MGPVPLTGWYQSQTLNGLENSEVNNSTLLGSCFDSQNGFTILGTRFGSPDLSNFQHTLYGFHNDSAILGAGFGSLMALPFWVPNLAALLLNLFWVPNVAPLMALLGPVPLRG